MGIIQSLQWRYATKKFDSKRTLSKEQLEVLKKAFNLTATSYGLQPVKLVIINDKALQKELVLHSMGQQQVADASHLLVFCIEDTIDADYIGNYFRRVKDIRKTPDEILSPFENFLKNDFETKQVDDVHNWAKMQAYLAMGNLLTVCAVEQIDACPMEGFLPEKYDQLLKLREMGLRSVLVLPVGFRAQDDVFSEFKKVRKELSESVIEL
ncbi:NAD(P)H-dependent oxidoreductase [Sungkyunkwania multivorans]|uniref:NAD(P)H-dependent oxidoreductase n=1 Tax=Sungkyunkwania multivorans TaxID=1173618 RepID=A0ABW3CUZ0_9FLAO